MSPACDMFLSLPHGSRVSIYVDQDLDQRHTGRTAQHGMLAGMAGDAAVRARLQKSGMGALAPAAGMQALAVTLTMSGPAPAVLSAAPIRWEVLLGRKATPPFFAEVAHLTSLATTPIKVSCLFLYPVE